MANQFMTHNPLSGPAPVARIELKTTPEVKRKFESAARAAGMTTTAFVVSHCNEAAERILAEQRTTYLNNEAWDRLSELMDRPPQATAALKELMRKKHNVAIEL